jgi:hypothetical protein
MITIKKTIQNCILTTAFAVYPLCAFAQSASEDSTSEPLVAPPASSAPGEATIAPSLALKQPDATLRSPDQMDATSLLPGPQTQLAPFRPTMGMGAYLDAKAAVEHSAATARPALSQGASTPYVETVD